MKITIDRSTVEQALEALEGLRLGMPDSVLTRSLDQRIEALRAALAELCPCGDRPAAQCPGEWEPGCDLGNNPEYARRVNLAEPEPPLGKASTDVGVPVYVVKKAEPVQENKDA